MPTLPPRSLLMLLLLACPLATGAPIVKCRADDGGILYQDSACKTGMELRNFDTDPATVSVVPGWPVTTTTPDTAHRSREAPVARRSPDRKVSSGSGSGSGSGKAAERRFIRTGMSEAEVLRRIGKPEVDAGPGRNQTKRKAKEGKHWSYLPAAGDPDTVTTLTIVSGLVANVERKVVR
jgi:hypothetical protein